MQKRKRETTVVLLLPFLTNNKYTIKEASLKLIKEYKKRESNIYMKVRVHSVYI
jgi:hypothetical protein